MYFVLLLQKFLTQAKRNESFVTADITLDKLSITLVLVVAINCSVN